MRCVLVTLVAVAALAGVVHADEARPQAVYRASVALADKEGAQHAIVTSKLTCGTPAKCPEWTLDLGPADAASVLVLVDLFGKPAHVRYASDATAPSLVLPGDAKLPAAFVRTQATDAANTRWERWTLVSLEGGRAKVIWSGELTMTREKGGGFTTLDGVELVAGEVGKPLTLELAQTSVPSPNEKARKPSAPLHRRFVMKDGTYQRE